MGGNLEAIWDSTENLFFPFTTVFLTIDLCTVWMAFPRILGCHCCSLTELFNSARRCCFRPRLLSEAFHTIAVSSLSHTFYTVDRFLQPTEKPLQRTISYQQVEPEFIYIFQTLRCFKHVHWPTVAAENCNHQTRPPKFSPLTIRWDGLSSSFHTAAPLWCIQIWFAKDLRESSTNRKNKAAGHYNRFLTKFKKKERNKAFLEFTRKQT